MGFLFPSLTRSESSSPRWNPSSASATWENRNSFYGRQSPLPSCWPFEASEGQLAFTLRPLDTFAAALGIGTDPVASRSRYISALRAYRRGPNDRATEIGCIERCGYLALEEPKRSVAPTPMRRLFCQLLLTFGSEVRR